MRAKRFEAKANQVMGAPDGGAQAATQGSATKSFKVRGAAAAGQQDRRQQQFNQMPQQQQQMMQGQMPMRRVRQQ